MTNNLSVFIQDIMRPYCCFINNTLTLFPDLHIPLQDKLYLMDYMVLNILIHDEIQFKNWFHINYFSIINYFKDNPDFLIVNGRHSKKVSVETTIKNVLDIQSLVINPHNIPDISLNDTIRSLDDIHNPNRILSTVLYLVKKYVIVDLASHFDYVQYSTDIQDFVSYDSL